MFSIHDEMDNRSYLIYNYDHYSYNPGLIHGYSHDYGLSKYVCLILSSPLLAFHLIGKHV